MDTSWRLQFYTCKHVTYIRTKHAITSTLTIKQKDNTKEYAENNRSINLLQQQLHQACAQQVFVPDICWTWTQILPIHWCNKDKCTAYIGKEFKSRLEINYVRSM